MKKILILIFVFIFFSLFLYHVGLSKKNVLILPNDIVCSFHKNLSPARQETIAAVIQNIFKSGSSPEEIVAAVSKDFDEVDSIRMQICQSDKICFYVDTSTPLFILNCAFVVCQSGAKVNRDFFDPGIVSELAVVIAEHSVKLEPIIEVIINIEPDVVRNFEMHWIDDSTIKFIKKNDPLFIIIGCAQFLPTMQDVMLCENIDKNLRNSKKNNKKDRIYDLRFHNQIIVR